MTGRTSWTGPQPLAGAPQARWAGELCEAPQTAPSFHSQPFLSSAHKEQGRSKPSPPADRSRGAASGTRQEKAGQWQEGRGSHPHPQTSQSLGAQRWLRSQGNRRPQARCLLPHGHGPTPNPSGDPAPTHPGAGVGGCRVGSRSNRRGSSAPRTCWLPKARSLPSYLRRSQPQAPRPARARKLRPGAAEAQSAQQRGEAPSSGRSGGSSSPAKSLSSLPHSVGSCVGPSEGPSFPRCSRRHRRSSPSSAARPLPA